jgi:hypothetical protein
VPSLARKTRSAPTTLGAGPDSASVPQLSCE